MKLIFAVLDVSLTMGLTRCYKTEGFFYIYLRLMMVKTNRSTLHTVYYIQQSATQGSNDTTH